VLSRPAHSKAILLITFLLSSLMGLLLAFSLRFDYQLERLFPAHDPERVFYQEYQQAFNSKDDYLAIGIYHEQGLFHAPFLHTLDSLTHRLQGLPGVREVSSLTNLNWLKVYGMGLKREIPLLRPYRPDRYQQDSAFLFSLPQFRHNYYSDDGRACCLYLRIKPGLAQSPEGDQLLASVEKALEEADFDAYHLSGYLPSSTYHAEKLEKEMLTFSVLSGGLIILFLFLAFRSFWGIWVPLLIVGLSGLWALGLMSLVGVPVNFMTVLLPSIMFVVATSDVVHLLSHYFGERRKGLSSEAALQRCVQDVGLPTFLTSLTTALGLLTLLAADVTPLQQLGAFAAVGVMMAFGLTYLILPPLIRLFPPPDKALQHPTHARWPKTLEKIWKGVKRKPGLIIAGSLLACLLGLIGAGKAEVHNYFARELKADDPISQDVAFFEKNFGGVRPFALSLQLKDSSLSVTEPNLLRKLEQLNHYLKEQYGLNRAYDWVSMLQAANSSLHRGRPEHFALPRDEGELERLVFMVWNYSDSLAIAQVYDRGHRLLRFSGSVPDWGSREAARRNEALTDFLTQTLDSSQLSFHLTGQAELMDRSHRLVAENMMWGLLLALLVVGLIMGLLFRSFPMALISLLPNLLPLLLVLGLIGWLGLSLNMATSIIFTIAFGIAVDDTIHFIARFRQEMKKSPDPERAVQETFVSTGKAILITSMVISSGFLVLVVSDFRGTSYTGWLISLTLAFAVLIDLLLLPHLLRVYGKNRANAKKPLSL
jgi:predicted RND superfamily exporter protein